MPQLHELDEYFRRERELMDIPDEPIEEFIARYHQQKSLDPLHVSSDGGGAGTGRAKTGLDSRRETPEVAVDQAYRDGTESQPGAGRQSVAGDEPVAGPADLQRIDEHITNVENFDDADGQAMQADAGSRCTREDEGQKSIASSVLPIDIAAVNIRDRATTRRVEKRPISPTANAVPSLLLKDQSPTPKRMKMDTKQNLPEEIQIGSVSVLRKFSTDASGPSSLPQPALRGPGREAESNIKKPRGKDGLSHVQDASSALISLSEAGVFTARSRFSAHASSSKRDSPLKRKASPVVRSRPSESGQSGVNSPSTAPTPTSDPDASNVTSPSNSPVVSSNDGPVISTISADDPKIKKRRAKAPDKSTKKGPVALAAESTTTGSGSKPGRKAKAKTKKEKPALTTPVEYATRLIRSVAEAEARNSEGSDITGKPKVPQFLKGKRIYYCGGDMLYASESTRGRMDFIVRHGGTLIPKYDPSTVTHVFTGIKARPTLRALGLKSAHDIPRHIPVLEWTWVNNTYGKTNAEPTIVDELFTERVSTDNIRSLDTARKMAELREKMKAPGAGKIGNGDESSNTAAERRAGEYEDISHISVFTEDRAPSRASSSVAPLSEDGMDSDEPASGPIGEFAEAMGTSGKGECRSRSSSVMNHDETKIPASDPLAEFYDQARVEIERAWTDPGSDSDNESGNVIHEPSSSKISGFACDQPNAVAPSGTCANQDIVDKLELLKGLHDAKPSKDDGWRSFSYTKSIRAIRNYPKRITSLEEARSIRGVGEKTALKIMEILKTGELRRIGFETTDDVEATKLFQGIYGVGRTTAFKWYAGGCRTLDDIRSRKGDIQLSPAQEIGLQFYDDINDRMPREEAGAIYALIKLIALSLDPELVVEIMGSYRRGKKDCGDIDILITRPVGVNGQTHAGVLRRLLRRLHAENILTEDLCEPGPEDEHDLEAVYRGLCHLPNVSGCRRRRIDFLTVPWHARGAALLYYTGDDIFNRSMRLKANREGYSLNQRGLFAGVVRNPRDRRQKTNEGTCVASETEQEIFAILGVPWQEPHQRVRG